MKGTEGTKTVLVVDDERIVREVAQRALERAGFDVLSADDGQQAVEIFRQHSDEIDAVLLDLSLPLLPGERVLAEVRSIRNDVRVIITSGHAEEEVMGRLGSQAGVTYIRKPYLPRALAEQVSQVLAAR